MNSATVLKKLAACGSAQTRKTYARHGVREPMFGVSYKDLGILTRQLKGEHELAIELWNSGNHDARVLATMIADAGKLTAVQIDCWLKEVENYALGGAFAGLVASSRFATSRAAKWRSSKREWTSYVGWHVTSSLVLHDPNVSDEALDELLKTIDSGIHEAPNRARYAMNNALIAIGLRNPRLEKLAVAAARRIGKVEIDHGDTSCKTPDAAEYIVKTAARRRKESQG